MTPLSLPAMRLGCAVPWAHALAVNKRLHKRRFLTLLTFWTKK